MEILFNPLTGIIVTIVVLIYSAILHEIAHGLIADKLGDPTARLLGRITLDPRPHIDPVFSLLMPIVLFLASDGRFIFGGAKPVPVDPFNLQDGRKDLALVSLAGPGTNIIIAVLASILFAILPTEQNLLNTLTYNLQFSTFYGEITFISVLTFLLATIVYVNVLLAVFNLLPIPPLDGSKIFAMLLPEKQAQAYLSLGTLGFLLIFLLLMFPIGGFTIGQLVSDIMRYLLGFLSF